MQKFTLSICCLCTILVIGLSSCKDDDDPFVPANLSVNTETLTISEAGGTASIEIILDKAAPSDITVQYDLGGTAISPADYSVVGTEGEIEIPQGQTSATIEIDIINDAVYEGNETIEISLEDVDTQDVIIVASSDEALITITEDDAQLKLSMAAASVTANEDDGELIIEVTLDNPAPQALTIGYSLSGTAIDTAFAVAQTPQPIPPQYWDYYAHTETLGEAVIPQGATKGEIILQILSDFQFEDSETIIVTLDDASSGEITANNKTTITVEQQDGKAIALVWGIAPDNYTDVDLDIFLWIGDEVADLFFAASSTNPSVTEKVEALIIPNIIENAVFGLSYTYWGGTASPMNFQARFIDFTDGEVDPVQANWDIYSATYTSANINKWDVEGAPSPAIAQTFEKSAGAIVNVSDPIVVPATGSRMITGSIAQWHQENKEQVSNAFQQTKITDMDSEKAAFAKARAAFIKAVMKVFLP